MLPAGRALLAHGAELAGWRYGQEVIWRKANGSGLATDRFRKVHEVAMHFYRGRWTELTRTVPRVPRGHDLDRSARKRDREPAWHGSTGAGRYVDDGTRLTTSVMTAGAARGREAWHPTEKPQQVLAQLVAYSSAVGDVVLDPFAGGGPPAWRRWRPAAASSGWRRRRASPRRAPGG